VGPAVAQLGLDESVLVTTARGVHARPLAEFVFMALLAHFRGLAHLQAEQRAHRWTRGCATEIAGRTLVILGAGDLARGCARLARALDMQVVAIARDPARTRAHADLFDEVVPASALHAALRRADALVVTVPGIPQTEGMVDAAALACLPRGAALVNIGRGTVVDEAALIDALRTGQVGYAALDVTAVEPLPPDSPLWDMPNVLISPHSASTVSAENRRIVEIFASHAGGPDGWMKWKTCWTAPCCIDQARRKTWIENKPEWCLAFLRPGHRQIVPMMSAHESGGSNGRKQQYKQEIGAAPYATAQGRPRRSSRTYRILIRLL
jgi:hypothetical protein